MKKFYAIIMMAAALAACVQIEQPEIVEEPEVIEEPETVQTYTLTVEATKGGDEASKALSLGGVNNKTLYATWAEGERVTVHNVTKGTDLEGYLAAQSSGESTTLKGDLTGTVEPNDKLVLKFLSPDYANQNGTLEYIAANCDYAESDEITVTAVSGNRITASDATFTNQQAIVKFTLKQKVDGSDVELPATTELIVNDAANDYTVTPASATNVLFVALPATSTVNLSTTIGGITYSYNKTGANLVAGKYYEITVKMKRDLVNLANINRDITLFDDDVVTGTLGSNRKISIADGATVTLSEANINGSGTWNSGNYAGINCLGDATIVLADGTTNTVKGFNQNYPGIQAAKRSGEGEEYTLTIQGTGTLNASSNGYAAGIGGGFNISCGNIIINGGEITANGGTRAAGIGAGGVNNSGSPTCGDITINGGTVAAYGGSNAAGIGNGAYYTGGSPSCGDITINGGEVTATGGSGNQGGAGIGNGHSNGSCGDITISGGSVTATGGNGSAGIGGGYYRGNCGAIIISGGTVRATGGSGNQEGAAGIGGGYNSACGDITISGGTVTANGGYKGVGIGSGYCADGGNILISGGTVTATGGSGRTGIGAGYGSDYHCGDITIENTVTRVTATKGENAVHSIGISYSGRSNCGTVTIGGVTGAISESPYTYVRQVLLSNVTSSHRGWIVCSDGYAYESAGIVPDGKTAVAKIAYVGSENGLDGSSSYSSTYNHGLAIALADEGEMNWSTAVSTCSGKTPTVTGALWLMPSIEQWFKIGDYGTIISNHSLQTGTYWTGLEQSSNQAYIVSFSGHWTSYQPKSNTYKVRAGLVF
ncbi:MAG: hypothetical protein IKZ51_08770 [Bacteroidales bacterium]|nr:hypothetical protein [Bacteroidales bacterium]